MRANALLYCSIQNDRAPRIEDNGVLEHKNKSNVQDTDSINTAFTQDIDLEVRVMLTAHTLTQREPVKKRKHEVKFRAKMQFLSKQGFVTLTHKNKQAAL